MNISVIIPSYNSGPVLDETVSAILASTVAVKEIIVVDDHSDCPVKNHKVTIIRNPYNQGRVSSRNIGANRATGDYLLFIDSDVLIRPDSIAQALEILKCEADGVVAIYDDSPSKDLSLTGNYKNCYMNFFLKKKAFGNIDFVVGSFFMIKRRSFLPWPEFNYYGEDSLYGKLLSENSKTLRLSESVLIHHKKNYTPFTLANNAFKMGQGWMMILLQRLRLSPSEKGLFHAGFSQLLSLCICGISLILAMIDLRMMILALMTLLMVNGKFYLYLGRTKPFRFFMGALFLLPMEYYCMMGGIVSGLWIQMKDSMKMRTQDKLHLD